MDTTIKDIALRAGISYSTVSRALNGKYGVKRETRERILDIAAQMDYRPNAIARGLIKKKTETIGLVIPDLRNPFFPEVAAGIESASEGAGYSVFLCASDWSPDREDRYLSLLLERRVDGIIIAPVRRHDGAEPPGLTGRIPAVYVTSTPHVTSHPYVTINNRQGGFLATSHLIEKGHAPVAFIGAADGSETGEERRAGYREALEYHGLKYEPRLVKLGPFAREHAAEATTALIRSGAMPRGIFAENDNLALAIIDTLVDAGFSIPGDVAVVGFDDITIARMHAVELSTIAQPIHEMGRRAVELLLTQIRGEGRPEHVVLEPKLIQRATT